MKIQYITTDLEFESKEDLDLIVKEFGDEVCPHLNERIGDVYRVALGGAFSYNHPEQTVERFCKLIDGLSDQSKILWKTCNRRVLDIAFESGTEPKSVTYQLPAELVRRVSKLGISIAVTIYPVGSYSFAEDSDPT
jgi:hypothetical protein